jgi:hypothetical protein
MSMSDDRAKARERNRRYRERHADDPAYRAAKAARNRRHYERNRKAVLARQAESRAERKAEVAAQLHCRACGNPEETLGAARRRAEWRKELARLREAGLAPPAPKDE